MLLRLFCLLFILTMAGCTAVSAKKPEPDAIEPTASKILLPVNIAAGYFGSIASQEAGHSLAAIVMGADKISVSVLPDSNSFDHLGSTTITMHRQTSTLEDTFFNISGTLSGISTDVFFRELLKSGEVPYVMQPTLQWCSVFCKAGAYAELMFGLCKAQDFQHVDRWISIS